MTTFDDILPRLKSQRRTHGTAKSLYFDIIIHYIYTLFPYTLYIYLRRVKKWDFCCSKCSNPYKSRSLSEHMKEADIVRAILKHLKTVPDCFAWKEHGGMYGTAGVPDIICCHKGHFFAFEVKTPEGQLTALQTATIAKINKAGGTALVVRSVKEVVAALEIHNAS